MLSTSSEGEFPSCALCPLSYHQASLWKECLHLLCDYLVGIARLWLDPPESSLGWTQPIPATFLPISTSPTPWSSWWLSAGLPPIFRVSPELGTPELCRPELCSKFGLIYTRLSGTIPHHSICCLYSCWCRLGHVCLHCCQGTLPAFTAEMHFIQSDPSLYCCVEFFQPRCKTSHVSWLNLCANLVGPVSQSAKLALCGGSFSGLSTSPPTSVLPTKLGKVRSCHPCQTLFM